MDDRYRRLILQLLDNEARLNRDLAAIVKRPRAWVVRALYIFTLWCAFWAGYNAFQADWGNCMLQVACVALNGMNVVNLRQQEKRHLYYVKEAERIEAEAQFLRDEAKIMGNTP